MRVSCFYSGSVEKAKGSLRYEAHVVRRSARPRRAGCREKGGLIGVINDDLPVQNRRHRNFVPKGRRAKAVGGTKGPRSAANDRKNKKGERER